MHVSQTLSINDNVTVSMCLNVMSLCKGWDSGPAGSLPEGAAQPRFRWQTDHDTQRPGF